LGNLTKREVYLLAILVVVLIGAAYYNFILKGFLENYFELNDRIVSTEATLQEARRMTLAIDKAKEEIDEADEKIKDYDIVILPGLDRPSLIEMFDKNIYPISGDISVSFPLSADEMGSFNIQKVGFNFITDKANFQRILSNLKNEKISNRVIDSVISISPGVTSEENGEIGEIGESIYNVRITIEILTGKEDMVSFKYSPEQ